MNKIVKRLQLASYFSLAIGITAAVYLAVDTRQNNILTGVSFIFIILGIVLAALAGRKK